MDDKKDELVAEEMVWEMLKVGVAESLLVLEKGHDMAEAEISFMEEAGLEAVLTEEDGIGAGFRKSRVMLGGGCIWRLGACASWW